MTTPIETRCQLKIDHEGNHNPIAEVHKCFTDCPLCGGDRCEYELVTVEVWVKEEWLK